MNGSHSHNPPGNFGTLFVPSPQNAPSGRIRSANWKDNYGNLWLFGGHSMLHSLNDLWKFDPTTNLWTWMGGSTVGDLPTISSGFCTPSQANIPAARVIVGSTWQGQCGQLYLYGGFTQIQQNAKWADLWCINVNTLEWTLVNGSLTPNDSAFYGQQNISSPLNHPAALFGASSWKDLNGNFWLFGGVRALNGYKTMNTLWRYVPDTNCPQTVSLSAMTAPPDSSLCAGDSILLVASGGQSYLWQPQASLSNPFDSVTYAFPDSTTQYSLTISNECGQKTFQFRLVVNSDSNFNVAFQDTTICQGDTLNLLSGGGVNYHWIPESLCNNPHIPNPSIAPESTTLFELTVSNECFKKSLQVFVEVIPDSAKKILQSDSALCQGYSLSLSATGGSQYLWNSGENSNSVTISPSVNAYYTVTITDEFGCTATDSVFVSLNPSPVITVNPAESSICRGSDILLEANGGVSYQWYPKLFITNTFLNTITIEPEYSLTYTVIGSDIFGCKDSSKVQVEVKDCLLTIPNVFTPNDDGKNDRFEILCDGILPCHTQIYNRWGKLLFESDELEVQWDGTYNGQPVPEGTYFYLIETQAKSYKGTISIIR
jgi:gliding motility-associated-like protein